MRTKKTQANEECFDSVDLTFSVCASLSFHSCSVSFLLMSRFDADDAVLMCQKNAAVASAVNRPDLVQVKYVTFVYQYIELP